MSHGKTRIILSRAWAVAVCSREMQIKSDSLKQELDRRSRALIYGPPEVMKRRADENLRMREQADSLDAEIDKLRKSRQQ